MVSGRWCPGPASRLAKLCTGHVPVLLVASLAMARGERAAGAIGWCWWRPWAVCFVGVGNSSGAEAGPHVPAM